MQATFLLTLETGDDTDLLGIAEEVHQMVDGTFPVISCKPWQRPTLSSGVQPSTPPVAPVN